jgi:hypothetical protein
LILQINWPGFDRVRESNEFGLELQGVPLNNVREDFLKHEFRFEVENIPEVLILLVLSRCH